MKTAIELAARLSARYLDTKQMLPDELAHESAAMLRQQAEQLSAWLAANGPGGWIDDLRNKCEALEITNDALKAALNDAATSLNTISRLAGNEFYVGEDGERVETCMKHPDQIRGYAQSRYSAAIDAMKGKS